MKETSKQIKLQALKFYKNNCQTGENIQWQTKENFTLQQP